IVVHCGAKPVMVDILDDFTIDPERVLKAISPRTKCIIPVDIGGLPAQVEEIMRIAEAARDTFKPSSDEQHRLGRPLVLSDAAHSFGARWNGRPVGREADITGFSFHAVK